jgi:hypothetical protein
MSDRQDTGEAEIEPWDAARADGMVGRLMLVGLTYVDPIGDILEQRQMFGHVVSADADAGIILALSGSGDGERFALPPDLSAITEATAGVYRLRATGEEITNPELLATFTVHSRAEG